MARRLIPSPTTIVDCRSNGPGDVRHPRPAFEGAEPEEEMVDSDFVQDHPAPTFRRRGAGRRLSGPGRVVTQRNVIALRTTSNASV